MAIRVYADAYMCIQSIRVCSLVFMSWLIVAFFCNTVVECCFNGPVILGLYGLPKSLGAKYGSTSYSFTKYFYRMRSVALQ